jgi:predicted RNA-binding Zn ribbon-like protein
VRAFAAAIELREALFSLFSAVAASRAPAPDDLVVLNRRLAQAGSHDQIAAWPSGLTRVYADADRVLEAPLWPVARSAAEVLVSPEDRGRLKQCPSDECGWLFIDESRNRTRRWCDPALCGNRARVRSHYARMKARRALGT